MHLNKDVNILKNYIYETVLSSLESLTFGMLYKILNKQLKIERHDFKNAIYELVAEGEISYSYKHGCSFIEKSLEKPIQISKRIILVPHTIKYSGKTDEVVIKMQSGISFGRGDHPTTRLALRGIEYVFDFNLVSGSQNSTVLDIGTGNGILAIVSVMFGAGTALGIDTDTCARKEAKEHAEINGLENRVKISDMPVEKIAGQFSIITANLRYPTLKKLYPVISNLTGKNSVLVFSGIKVSECEQLRRLYTEKYFIHRREESEKGWSALVFQKF